MEKPGEKLKIIINKRQGTCRYNGLSISKRGLHTGWSYLNMDGKKIYLLKLVFSKYDWPLDMVNNSKQDMPGLLRWPDI